MTQSPFSHIPLTTGLLVRYGACYIRVADAAMMLGDGINWLGQYMDKELMVHVFEKKRYFNMNQFSLAAMERLIG